ncbi:hypothetical protein SUGI_0683100 [Cryptomeria japonica]|nr:hypothetical protein SUGI_0683100 [Cryptomeria japonica]
MPCCSASYADERNSLLDFKEGFVFTSSHYGRDLTAALKESPAIQSLPMSILWISVLNPLIPLMSIPSGYSCYGENFVGTIPTAASRALEP